jgi:hypothetical protein
LKSTQRGKRREKISLDKTNNSEVNGVSRIKKKLEFSDVIATERQRINKKSYHKKKKGTKTKINKDSE